MNPRRSKIVWACLSACILMPLSAGLAAAVGDQATISIKSLQYPGSPETVAVGERIPIGVTLQYSGMTGSTYSLHLAYADFPPRFQSGGETTLSGSGTYSFPPAEIMVPASYSIPGGWPKYINEWHLKAEIWKGDKFLGGKSFTLLVENPEFKPTIEITSIDYVIPPDTIAVNEDTPIKVHMEFSNLDPNTKIKAELKDSTGLLKSSLSKALHGKGTLNHGFTIAPKRAGAWVIEANISTTSGSLAVSDKKSFQINVVQAP
jgi:hypothetical protein